MPQSHLPLIVDAAELVEERGRTPPLSHMAGSLQRTPAHFPQPQRDSPRRNRGETAPPLCQLQLRNLGLRKHSQATTPPPPTAATAHTHILSCSLASRLPLPVVLPTELIHAHPTQVHIHPSIHQLAFIVHYSPATIHHPPSASCRPLAITIRHPSSSTAIHYLPLSSTIFHYHRPFTTITHHSPPSSTFIPSAMLSLLLLSSPWSMSAETLLGNISLACWMVVLLPQLYENYARQSCDGLSMGLVFFWLAGDLLNFLGSYLQGLQFSVVALAVYYVGLDILIIMQWTYYANMNASATATATANAADASGASSGADSEASRLLQHQQQHQQYQQPSCLADEAAIAAADITAADSTEQKAPSRHALLRRLLVAAAVCAAATFAALHAYRWYSALPRAEPEPQPQPQPQPGDPAGDIKLVPQLLGWLSTLLYFASRVPQILKNQRERSCEGLSPLMFVFIVLGNSTYAAAILLHSTAWSHIAKNLPWIIGSTFILFLDCIIFVQFLIYRRPPAAASPSS